MSPTPHTSSALAGAMLAAGLLAYAFLLWPGGVYTDTVGLIQQGQTGDYDDWHSPSLAAVLAVLGLVRSGPGTLLLYGMALLVCGLYLVLRRARLTELEASCYSVLIIFSPPLIAANFWLSKDTPALGALLIGSALVLSPVRQTIVLGTAFLFFAYLIRLDYGVLGAMVAGFAAFLRHGDQSAPRRLGKLILVAAAFFVASTVGQVAIHAALGVKSQAPVQASLLHDLAAISVETGDHRAPAFMIEQGWTHEFVTSHYDPLSHDPLKWPSDRETFAYTRNGSDHIDTISTWLGAVRDHPLTYLRHRFELTGALLGIVVPPKVSMPDAAWLEENSAISCQRLEERLQMDDCAFEATDANVSVLRAYERLRQAAPWTFAPITFAVLCVLGLLGVAGRAMQRAFNPGLLLIAALPILHLPVLFLVVPSAEYRYLTLMIVAGHCVMAIAVSGCFGELKRRMRN